MISFTEYCFCFWDVFFLLERRQGDIVFLELLKGGKEGRDVNNNINTNTNTNTNTD